MSAKTKKFLRNIETITEDEAITTLASLTEKEIEELCKDAEALDEESREKLLSLLEAVPEELDEDAAETAAGQTIKSKTGMIANAVGAMTMMPPEDLSHFLDQALAASQQYASSIPDDAAAKNAATVAMKGAIKEDLDTAIFGDADLSEELKFKITTLFESAVNARVALKVVELEEQYEEAVMENLEFVTESLTESTDKYLSYVAQEWLKENELQVETGLKEEISSEFIAGLKQLFVEHYIDIPADQEDAVTLLATKVASLEEKLNEAIEENIELKGVLSEATKEDIVNELTEGMTIAQANTLRSLAENVDFDGDVDTFVSKLSVLKESNFTKTYTPSNILTEEFVGEEEETVQKQIAPDMAAYVSALRSSKIR